LVRRGNDLAAIALLTTLVRRICLLAYRYLNAAANHPEQVSSEVLSEKRVEGSVLSIVEWKVLSKIEGKVLSLAEGAVLSLVEGRGKPHKIY